MSHTPSFYLLDPVYKGDAVCVLQLRGTIISGYHVKTGKHYSFLRLSSVAGLGWPGLAWPGPALPFVELSRKIWYQSPNNPARTGTENHMLSLLLVQ